jgi:hypothetical protein
MIGPNSGALAPYDLQLSSAEAASDSMIIGHRDLRPILSRLNPQARAWVVLDACYSENAVKSLGAEWEGPPRAINLVSVLKPPARQTQTTRQTPQPLGSSDAITTVPLTASESSEPYPYSNVISFSAASRDETARDISREMLRSGKHQTIDGNPHGAFTNGLLLALNGFADTNHDGSVTYDELFRATREFVQAESKQRPQVLPRAGDALSLQVLSDAGGAGASVTQNAPPTAGNATVTRVALDSVDAELRRRVSAVAKVEIVSDRFDLLIRQRNGVLELHDRSLALIREYSLAEAPIMMKRIAAQSDVDRLLNFQYSAQNFNLTVDVDSVSKAGQPQPDFRSEFTLGESVAITLSTEKPAYLLVLDIDTAGVISVLYPGPKDAEPYLRTDPFEVLRAKVRSPTGSEFVKAFGFVQKPLEFEQFTCRGTDRGLACPEIEPGDERYERLLMMLASGSTGGAEAHTRILTRDQ